MRHTFLVCLWICKASAEYGIAVCLWICTRQARNMVLRCFFARRAAIFAECAAKRMHPICVKFVHHILIRNAPHFYGLPLDLYTASTEYNIAAFFCQTRRDFCRTRRNSAKRATFSRERHRNPRSVALYKMAHSQ